MREWFREFFESFLVAVVAIAAVVPIAVFVSWAIDAVLGMGEPHSTWPESAEFSTLATGQERFSEHATNVDGLVVVVDHATGAQYLADGDGMTALLDVDGSPLRVLEAGDDGE